MALAGSAARARAEVDARAAIAIRVRLAGLRQAAAACDRVVADLIERTDGASALATMDRQTIAGGAVALVPGLAHVAFVAIAQGATVEVAACPFWSAHPELGAGESIRAGSRLARAVVAPLAGVAGNCRATSGAQRA